MATLEHILARQHGGTTVEENLAWAAIAAIAIKAPTFPLSTCFTRDVMHGQTTSRSTAFGFVAKLQLDVRQSGCCK